MRPDLVLVRPIITEKSMTGTNSGRYTFAVAKAATKQEIAQAVAESFKVDVIAVNTATVHGKTRRIGKKIGKQSDWKKAVVTLAEGQRIERYFVEAAQEIQAGHADPAVPSDRGLRRAHEEAGREAPDRVEGPHRWPQRQGAGHDALPRWRREAPVPDRRLQA
jgi:large subunit ribosomal protein L23